MHCTFSFRSGNIDITFDRTVYQERIQYEDAQDTNHLLYIRLTRELFDNESLISSRIVGKDVSAFSFNITSLSIVNLVPLSPGRHEFSLVLIIRNGLVQNLIPCSVVLDILSPSKFIMLSEISVKLDL